jgi:hypothetical protein
MRGYGLREIALKFSANRFATVRRLMAPLKFSREELSKLADACGIYDLDKPLNVLGSPSFQRLADHPVVQKQARTVGEEARNALNQYLETIGFFKANRVVLVDVGWAGQIQEGIQLAISDKDTPELHTYYLGANAKADERRRSGLKIQADFIDVTRYEWTGGATFSCVQLFEISCRAPHGTTIGYKNGEPLLLSDEHQERLGELPDEDKIVLLQEGIRSYLRHYARYVTMSGATARDSMTYARNIVARLIRFPRYNELRIFTSLTNVANFGSGEQISLANLPTLFSPFGFLTAVNNSLWREGAVALRAGRLGSIVLSILREPRLTRNLPPQTSQEMIDILFAPPKDGPPTTATHHSFEGEMQQRSLDLAEQARAQGPLCRWKQALSPFELGVLRLAHSLTIYNLRRHKLTEVPADLLPLRTWIWREIYIRLSLSGKFGQLLRYSAHRINKIK